MTESFKCWYRKNGFTNCDCPRFEGGACVNPSLREEHRIRRDAAWGDVIENPSVKIDRTFSDSSTYNPIFKTKE